VAGYAGERLKYLGRITGLDPADPYYTNTQPVVRLDESDALFVDVIHTDSGRILNLIQSAGAGIKQVSGHVDFYPNGGEVQPGCPKSIFENALEFTKCNHNRAIYLFMDSINSESCKFKAVPCDSYAQFKRGECTSCGQNGCSYMGNSADEGKPPSGVSGVKYYLDTNGEAPFCVNTYIVKVNLGKIGTKTPVRPQSKYYLEVVGTNGNTETLQLNSQYKSFEGEKSYNFAVSSKTNPGTIKSLRFKWKARYSFSSKIPVTVNSIQIASTGAKEVRSLKFCGIASIANVFQDLYMYLC